MTLITENETVKINQYVGTLLAHSITIKGITALTIDNG
jgi:hypothetical protein